MLVFLHSEISKMNHHNSLLVEWIVTPSKTDVSNLCKQRGGENPCWDITFCFSGKQSHIKVTGQIYWSNLKEDVLTAVFAFKAVSEIRNTKHAERQPELHSNISYAKKLSAQVNFYCKSLNLAYFHVWDLIEHSAACNIWSTSAFVCILIELFNTDFFYRSLPEENRF